MSKKGDDKVFIPVNFDPEMVGMRLDRALARTFPRWSRSGIGELIANEAVYVNGDIVKKGTRNLRKNDVVALHKEIMATVKREQMFARETEEFTNTGSVSAVIPEDIPLDIVYEDDDMLVVDKPVGMVVHPAYANTSGTLANAVAGYFKKSGIPLIKRVGLVHRLDKDVSGLMVIAKNSDALTALSQQFSSDGIDAEDADMAMKAIKLYWAVVGPVSEKTMRNRGLPAGGDELTVEGYMWKSPKDRKVSVFAERVPLYLRDNVKYRYALSYIRTEKKLENSMWLMCIRIVTGRTHQIRAQLASKGLAIYGDVAYGGEKRYDDGIGLRCVALGVIPPEVYFNDQAGRKTAGISEGKEGCLYVQKGRLTQKPGQNSQKSRYSGVSLRNRVIIERFEVP